MGKSIQNGGVVYERVSKPGRKTQHHCRMWICGVVRKLYTSSVQDTARPAPVQYISRERWGTVSSAYIQKQGSKNVYTPAKEPIRIVIPGRPVPKARPRLGRGGYDIIIMVMIVC